MNLRYLGSENFHTTNWLGGETCELYLYPSNGSYAARDFLFRLSSATVKQDGAPFTALPGVRRSLMLLTGKLTLEQSHSMRKVLHPFVPITFSGSASVRSFGQGRDFNLMLRENAQGQLSYTHLTTGEVCRTFTPSFGKGTYWKAVYAVYGSVTLRTDDCKTCTLVMGEMALLQADTPFEATLLGGTVCSTELALADIFVPTDSTLV